MGSACVLDGEKAEEQIDTDAELYDKIYRGAPAIRVYLKEQ